MIPILDLPRTFRRLGKIRLGEQLPVMEGGKQKIGKAGAPVFRPAKLERFRLTSPDRDLLDHAGEVYGGEVREWAGAPGDGDQWELYLTSAAVDIIVPPQHQSATGDLESGSFQQWYEMWSAGGRARRCDGVTEHVSGKPCSAQSPACPVDHESRREAAAKGNACKMTTRIMVILPKLPDLGVWMLESHGWYAAVELGGFMEFLASRAPGQFVPGVLQPEARQVKRAGKTHNFVVPVIKLPQGTAGELLAAPAVQSVGPGGDRGIGTGLVTDAERVRTFVIACSDKGWSDDTRHAIVGYATKGRTRSSREVAVDEWPAVEAVVRWLSDGKLVASGDGDATVLVKPGATANPAPAPATAPANGTIPAQSRELPAEPEFDVDPPVGDLVDDFSRIPLLARVEKLDDEHREIALAEWTAAGIPPPNSDRLTVDDAARANELLLSVEERARETWKNRATAARTAMAEIGVKTDSARLALLNEATEGKGDIKRLTVGDARSIDAYCRSIADAEAAETAAAS